ncbi:MAG TPA: hypothetical protein VMT50_07155 [Steroidobacteraceae bacterium]|nr:hypothetical protein [Steroidobacteraceae bacterium]
MPIVKGCNLPDELLYDVANQVWYRELGDGTVMLGMTSVAAAMSGRLVAYTPRPVGREIPAGKSCATVESGKWVGPVKTLAAGTIIATNAALGESPSLVNQDPYGEGWLVVLRPIDWETAKRSLLPGGQVGEAYRSKMDEEGFIGCS